MINFAFSQVNKIRTILLNAQNQNKNVQERNGIYCLDAEY